MKLAGISAETSEHRIKCDGRFDGTPPVEFRVARVGGTRANVGVVDGPRGPYVRTYADGKWNDNLLALVECV